MPAKAPQSPPAIASKAALLGSSIRDRRKRLKVSAASASASAGMSRATWHRIEGGELSVTLGAYLAAMDVLDMPFQPVTEPVSTGDSSSGTENGSLPLRILLADFPQLRRLAWQVHGVDTLTPREALGFYERNWRHIDNDRLEPRERQLIEALREVFKESKQSV